MVRTARVGTLSIFLTSLVLSTVWRYSGKVVDSDGVVKEKMDHAFSGGVVFSIVMLLAGNGISVMQFVFVLVLIC